jgi:hypothetical protein
VAPILGIEFSLGWADLAGRLMMPVSSLFVNCTAEARAAAAGGGSASGLRFEVKIQETIDVKAATASKYASSGVRYSRD